MASIPIEFLNKLMHASSELEITELAAEYPETEPLISELRDLLARSPGQDVASLLKQHPEVLGRYLRHQSESFGDFIKRKLDTGS